MKLLRLLLLLVFPLGALLGKNALIVVDDHLQSRGDGEGGFRVREGDRLRVDSGNVVYRSAAGRVISIAARELSPREESKVVDATSNAEQTNVALLVFSSDDLGKNLQRITVASGDQIRSISSDQLPGKMIISRLFSLSKSGRFLLADIGIYRDDGNGRFKVIYQPWILDLEENKILEKSGIDEWAEFRKL